MSIAFYAAQSARRRPCRTCATHAAVAKAQVTGRAAELADSALTLHGAIGYTWEHDLHLFYKRAKLDRVLFGTPAAWNERIADALPLLPRCRSCLTPRRQVCQTPDFHFGLSIEYDSNIGRVIQPGSSSGERVDFELSEDQQTIRAAVAELAGKFDDHYWMTKDQRHEFPTEFYDAFAEGGWLGITTPEEYGGHGFGITEASILLEEVARQRRGDERRQLDAPCRSSACTR